MKAFTRFAWTMGALFLFLAALLFYDLKLETGKSVRPYVISGFVAWGIAIAGRIADHDTREIDSRKAQRKAAADLLEVLKELHSRHVRLTTRKPTDEQIALALKTFDVLGQLLRRLRLEEWNLPADVRTREIARHLGVMFLAVDLDGTASPSEAKLHQEALLREITLLDDLLASWRG